MRGRIRRARIAEFEEIGNSVQWIQIPKTEGRGQESDLAILLPVAMG